MAEDIAKFQKIAEPQNWTWYNSERREVVGSHFSYIKDAYEGAGSTVQTFIFDGTGTDEDHTKTTTLLTLANGVHADIEWYAYEVSQGTPPRYGYSVQGQYKIVGKNGEVIYNGPFGVTSDIRESTSLDNIRLHYVASEISYDGNGMIPDSGLSGAGINTFGLLIGQSIYGAIEPPPPLSGEIEYADWVTRYSGARIGPYAYNWGEFADVYEDIVDAGDGTPISKEKPDDDTSKPDPGKPDYDPTSDDVPFPDIPDGGDALSTGFIHAYQPIGPQLQALAAKLWSDDFINTIKKIQNDPFEAIISLHSIPVSVAGGNANCVVGNYDSGISMPVVSSQWTQVNMGSYYIPQHFGSALDFAPYVSVDIFLPYIGVRSLQVDDIIGRTISVRYSIDVLSGATLASIMCNNSVLYTYNCNIAMEIPVTQSSFGPFYQSMLGATSAVLSGYGAAGAPGAAGAAVGAAVNVAMSKQHSISRGGNISGNFGCMGHFYPYLIIHRPKQSLAEGFNHFKGKPSNISTNLSSISGYTEIESIHLDGIACTENERDEIRALLYNGVIF